MYMIHKSIGVLISTHTQFYLSQFKRRVEQAPMHPLLYQGKYKVAIEISSKEFDLSAGPGRDTKFLLPK
jgi:hypothetical protein